MTKRWTLVILISAALILAGLRQANGLAQFDSRGEPNA